MLILGASIAAVTPEQTKEVEMETSMKSGHWVEVCVAERKAKGKASFKRKLFGLGFTSIGESVGFTYLIYPVGDWSRVERMIGIVKAAVPSKVTARITVKTDRQFERGMDFTAKQKADAIFIQGV